MGIWQNYRQAAAVLALGAAAWAIVIGAVYLVMKITGAHLELAGGVLVVIAMVVLVKRVQRRRQLAELQRRAGAPRGRRRAAHKAGGKAVWRATRGRLG